ncbi:MAG TPA: hypothetical protein VFS76_03880 [Pyrinomonadaceae bacterium]|nr:hypothetical protein [Pyrinomonadaceae bacterium]
MNHEKAQKPQRFSHEEAQKAQEAQKGFFSVKRPVCFLLLTLLLFICLVPLVPFVPYVPLRG